LKTAGEKSRAEILSEKLYRWLLIAYPASHRLEYGPAMTQLFRDQCRSAWGESQWRGLVALWLRTLPDLINTSIIERLATIKGKEFGKMLMQKPSKKAIAGSITIFIGIFLLVLTSAVIVTYLLPEKYASFARIKLEQFGPPVQGQSVVANNPTVADPYFLQTELAYIQSPIVLDKVIKNLKLNALWGKKYSVGTLKTVETRQLLKRQLELRPSRNTSLVEIRVYSDDTNEVVKIANEIANVYQENRIKAYKEFQATNKSTEPSLSKDAQAHQFYPVQIIDRAEPTLRPAYPNHYLDIFIGGILGIVVAATVGGLFLLIASRKTTVSRKPAATPQVQT
jgi:capsular polysaccharide biosynthesis protein